MHNLLWSEVFTNWLTYPKDAGAIEEGGLGARPAGNESGQPFLNNDSGEDFLYMRRQTVRYANKVLAQAGDRAYSRVEGWLDIPLLRMMQLPVPLVVGPSGVSACYAIYSAV